MKEDRPAEALEAARLNRASQEQSRKEAQRNRDLAIAQRLAKKACKAALRGEEMVDVKTGFERFHFLLRDEYNNPSVIGLTNGLLEPERLHVTALERTEMVGSLLAGFTKGPSFVPKTVLGLVITTIPGPEQTSAL